MLVITNNYITRIRKTADPYGFDGGTVTLAATAARVDYAFKKIRDAFGNDAISDIQIIIKDPAFDIAMGDTVLIGSYTAVPTGATPRAIRNLLKAAGLSSVNHIEVYL